MQQINYFSRISLFIFSSIVDNITASIILPFILIISPSPDYLVKQLGLMHIFARFYYTYDWLNLSWQVRVYVLASRYSVFSASRRVLWSCLTPSRVNLLLWFLEDWPTASKSNVTAEGAKNPPSSSKSSHMAMPMYPLPGKS